MARLGGVDLPEQKRLDIGLTYLYGIGRNNVQKLIDKVKIDPAKRVKDLTEEDINKIQKALEDFTIEGDLQREVNQNIRRLEEINSYRGSRHKKGLPGRGQRTRHNARTMRGKRKTVGTVKKEAPAGKAPAK